MSLCGIDEKILITSPHGLCEVSPYNVTKGKIPTIRSAKDRTLYFTKQAEETHGRKFDYSKVNYISSSSKIIIICPIQTRAKKIREKLTYDRFIKPNS